MQATVLTGNVRMTDEGKLQFIGRTGKPYQTIPFALFAKTKKGDYAPLSKMTRAKDYSYSFFDPDKRIVIDTHIPAKRSVLTNRLHKKVIQSQKQNAVDFYNYTVHREVPRVAKSKRHRVEIPQRFFDAEEEKREAEIVSQYDWDVVALTSRGQVVREPVQNKLYTLGIVTPNGDVLKLLQRVKSYKKQGMDKSEASLYTDKYVLFEYDEELHDWYHSYFKQFPFDVIVFIEQRGDDAYLSSRTLPNDKRRQIMTSISSDGTFKWLGTQWYNILTKAEVIYTEEMLKSPELDYRKRSKMEASLDKGRYSDPNRKYMFEVINEGDTVREVISKINFLTLAPRDKGMVADYDITADITMYNVAEEPVRIVVNMTESANVAGFGNERLYKIFARKIQEEIKKRGYHFTSLYTMDRLIDAPDEPDRDVEGLIQIRNEYEKMDRSEFKPRTDVFATEEEESYPSLPANSDKSLAPSMKIKFDVHLNIFGQKMYRKGWDVEFIDTLHKKLVTLRIPAEKTDGEDIHEYLAKKFREKRYVIRYIKPFERSPENKIFVPYGELAKQTAFESDEEFRKRIEQGRIDRAIFDKRYELFDPM